MYYVIKQSTDLRCRNTVIEKYRTIKAALQHCNIGNGEYAHADPEEARNYHHVLNRVYSYSGKIDQAFIKKEMGYGTSTYPVTRLDAIATFLYTYGTEIADKTPWK